MAPSSGRNVYAHDHDVDKTGCRHSTLRAEDHELVHVNAFQRCTDFIDENIQLFRVCVGLTAAIGVCLVTRSVRLFHTFRRVSDVPDEFIAKHVKLYGRTIRVQSDPVRVLVEHTPILRLWRFRPERKNHSQEGLPLHLAGLCIEEGGLEFLAERLASRPSLRFHLLRRNPSDGLDCIVTLPKWKFLHQRVSLNKELLRNGLASVAPLHGLRDVSLHARLTQRLLAAELLAERKSRGVWGRDRPPSPTGARLRSARDSLASRLRAAARKLVATPTGAVKGLWRAAARRMARRNN